MARRSTVLRASGALLEKVDGYARAVEKQTGVTVTRAMAAEALIKLGLRAVTKPRKTVDPLQQLAAAARDAERKR